MVKTFCPFLISHLLFPCIGHIYSEEAKNIRLKKSWEHLFYECGFTVIKVFEAVIKEVFFFFFFFEGGKGGGGASVILFFIEFK